MVGQYLDIGARLFDFAKIEIGTCIDSPCAIARAFNQRPVICFVLPFGGELETKASYMARVKPKYFSPESGLHITVGPGLYLKELFQNRLGPGWDIILKLLYRSERNFYVLKVINLDAADFDDAEFLYRKVLSYAKKKTNP